MSAFGACALVALAFALMAAWLQLIGGVISLARVIVFGARARHLVTADPLSVGVATAFGIGCALWIGRAWHDPNAPWRKLLALHSARWPIFAYSLFFGLAFQVPLTELQNLCELIFPIAPPQKLALSRLVTPDSWHRAIAVIFALVAIAPIFEELLFRGLLLGALSKSSGKISALVLSSVLFGLCHVRIAAAVIPACAAGLILGIIALRHRSTLPAIATHTAINAAPMLFSERVVKVPGFNLISDTVTHVPLPVLLGTSVTATAAFIGLMQCARRFDERSGTG